MKEKVKTIYPLYNDLMSKYIFGSEENSIFLATLLESFYNLEEGTLKDLKITNSVKLDLKTIKSKQYELDIKALLPNGNIINIEFYSCYNELSERKSFMYIADLYSNELKRGEDYSLLKRVSQINFVKHDYVHKSDEAIRKYLIINEANPKDFITPDLFQIYIINIDKKSKKSYNNVRNDFYKWLDLINAETEEERESIAKGNKIMESVVKKMEKFSETPGYNHFFSKENYDLNMKRYYEKKAKEKGLEEGKLETARNLLSMGMPITDIQTATGLSEEEIKSLQE